MVHSIVQSVRAKVRANNNVHFSMDIQHDTVFIRHEYRIIQILLNLLSNAVKFTYRYNLTEYTETGEFRIF